MTTPLPSAVAPLLGANFKLNSSKRQELPVEASGGCDLQHRGKYTTQKSIIM